MHVERPQRQEEPPDLLAALRASLDEATGGPRKRTGKAHRRSNGNGSLDRLSKADLQERAKDANVPGRSKMSKDELVEALRAA